VVVEKQDPAYIYLTLGQEQKQQAWDFVVEQSRLSYGCEPQQPPELLFAANKGGRIVGTVGLDLCPAKGGLPVESHYETGGDRNSLFGPREKLGYFSAWRANVPSVAPWLVYISARYAVSQGRERAACELNPSSVRRLLQMGVEVSAVPGCRLLLDSIPVNQRAYYELTLPSLHVVRFEQMVSALSAQFARSESQGILRLGYPGGNNEGGN
jgi:hypothetical protein